MTKGSREVRIDLVRGLSLLLIFVGHSNFVFSLAVQHSRGFADASELFVLMAGMSAALAYGPPDKGRAIPVRRILARVRRLYGVHLLLVFALLLLASLPSPIPGSGFLIENADMIAVWQVGEFRQSPWLGIDALLLRYMPADLDILPLYVALLAFLPVALFVQRRSERLLLLASAALWLAAGALHLNLPNLAQGSGRWFFDPLSWQFVFVLGVLLGTRVKRGLDPFPFHPALFGLAGAFALLSIPGNLLLQFTLPGRGLMADHHLLSAVLLSKSFGGVLRILDAAAILYLLWNLDLVRRAAAAPWLESIRAAGRHSLPVFASGLVLSMAMQGLMASGTAPPPVLQAALAILCCLVQLWVGQVLEGRRRRPAPGHAMAPPPVSALGAP